MPPDQGGMGIQEQEVIQGNGGELHKHFHMRDLRFVSLRCRM